MQFDPLRRRQLITPLGGAAVASWPLEARSQQETTPQTIAFVGSDSLGLS